MQKLYIDFETFSRVDLSVRGGHQYAHDPSTTVLCMAYAIENEPAEVWNAFLPPSDKLVALLKREDTQLIAFNVLFEWRIWNQVLRRQLLDFHDVAIPEAPLTRYSDVMSKCGYYQVPMKLKSAAEALNTKHKDLSGVNLIKLLCIPTKTGGIPDYSKLRADFHRLMSYCGTDVEVTREIDQTLPDIKNPEVRQFERRVELLTWQMNVRGLPYDLHSATAIKEAVDIFLNNELRKVSAITNGHVTTLSQYARIKNFCHSQGVNLPNTQASTLTKVLEDHDSGKRVLPNNVAALLKMRLQSGSTAIAKYKKGLAQAAYVENYDWYFLHDTLQYYGAGTGRWAGRGIQPQNFPRAKSKDPNALLERVKQKIYKGNYVQAAKKLIRHVITAPPKYTFFVFDYSGVENRVLHWVAGDTDTLELFTQGLDQYKDMASYKFNVPYEEVTKDQRFVGKVIILGCGFQMGGKKFKETSATFGLNMELAEATEAVNAYRTKYTLVVRLWSAVTKMVHQAIKCPGQVFRYLRVSAQVNKDSSVLAIQLPSERCIYYLEPKLEQKYTPGYEKYGTRATATHLGVNSYTRKWTRLNLIPGRITENIVQGTARDAMAQGMLNVADNMPAVKLVSTVHDEAISIIKKSENLDGLYKEYTRQLCDIPWATDCPITGEGYISDNYKKD